MEKKYYYDEGIRILYTNIPVKTTTKIVEKLKEFHNHIKKHTKMNDNSEYEITFKITHNNIEKIEIIKYKNGNSKI